MRRRSLSLMVLLVGLSCLAVAISAAAEPADVDRLWEETVASQPEDTAPFRAVRIPDWVQQTVGCGYTLSVMDRESREAAVARGVSISELGFVDPLYVYYDSRLLERRSPHLPPDYIERNIAEYKELGVRILAIYPPTLQGEVYEKHPEWRRIATNTREIPEVDLELYPHGGMLCLLGPYGDFLIEVLAEILAKYPDVDAFTFDGLHYGGVCYCHHCRDNFDRDHGAEIPDPDMADPAFRRYQHWADRRMEDLVRRMQTQLKGIKPDVALVSWTTNAGRFGHLLTIPRNMPTRMNLLLDAPDQEFWMDESNRGATIVPAFGNAYAWATTNHRVAFSEPYLMSHGNPYGKDSFPPEEILFRMMLVLTHGARPSIAVAQPIHLQPAVYEAMKEVQKRSQWLTHTRPEPWLAMVMSDNTRNFYGRSSGVVEQRYLASVLGTFRATTEEHLPVAVINDWNLNDADLERYRVLILPNTACLDEVQVAAVERFVRQGGGLVASLDTSLFDEHGDPRSNFALREVLGVDYQGLPDNNPLEQEIDVNFAASIGPDYWEKRHSVFQFRQDSDSWLNRGRMRIYVADQPVTFKGPALRVAPANDARLVGRLRSAAPADSPEFPAVVARTYGKGRVVYLAAGIDAAYYLYSYPYQRLVLRHAIEWVSPAPPPIRVNAPMSVHATFMRQEQVSRTRLIVHLLNNLNTTSHRALPVDDVPLREEFVPIHGIQVTFDADYPIRSVRLEPDGSELQIESTSEGKRVTVPKLDVHALVVAELDTDQ